MVGKQTVSRKRRLPPEDQLEKLIRENVKEARLLEDHLFKLSVPEEA